jgi:CRP-like cAMP-binding protein
VWQKVHKIFQLSEEAYTLLLAHGKEKRWKRGAFLLREGEKCKDIHFIKEGSIRAFQVKDGKDVNLRFYFEEVFATNMKSLRQELPSEHHLQAMEALWTHTFSKSDLLQLYTVSPEIVLWGRNLLESLLIEQEAHADFFKLYSPEERYMRVLAHEPTLIQRLSLSQIASYLGITRETLSRIRARIK